MLLQMSYRTIRSVSSCSTFQQAHEEPLPVYSTSPFSTSEMVLVSPSSSPTAGLSSPLGSIHQADPSSVSKGMRALCKLLPKTILARRMQKASSPENVARVAKEIDEKAKLKEEAERQKKVEEILEADRIMDYNLKQWGF